MAGELRVVLETALGKPLLGDLVRLLRMLSAVFDPLTRAALQELGGPAELIARGRGQRDPVDDVTAYVLGLAPEYGQEFKDLARTWRGRMTELKRAILDLP